MGTSSLATELLQAVVLLPSTKVSDCSSSIHCYCSYREVPHGSLECRVNETRVSQGQGEGQRVS